MTSLFGAYSSCGIRKSYLKHNPKVFHENISFLKIMLCRFAIFFLKLNVINFYEIKKYKRPWLDRKVNLKLQSNNFILKLNIKMFTKTHFWKMREWVTTIVLHKGANNHFFNNFFIVFAKIERFKNIISIALVFIGYKHVFM